MTLAVNDVPILLEQAVDGECFSVPRGDKTVRIKATHMLRGVPTRILS